MRSLGVVTYLCRDYDEAAGWFTSKLGFRVVQDVDQGADLRWLVVSPDSGPAGGTTSFGASLLLAQAGSPEQQARVGNQAGDRVGFILSTSDFAADHAAFTQRGVEFLELPRVELYGTVAVFRDLYGNTWDLIERSPPQSPKPAASASVKGNEESTKQ